MEKKERKIKVIAMRLGRSEATDRLYILEQRRNHYIKECAREWGKIMENDNPDFWDVCVPTQLYDTLGSFDRPAAIIAAREFLLTQGYTSEVKK